MLHSQKGAVLIELTIILPLMIALTFATLEMYRMIQIKMILQTLSKQAAYSAKRDCMPRTGADLTACINQTAATVNAVAIQAISNFSTNGGIVVSYWRDSDGIVGVGPFDSKGRPTNVSTNSTLGALVRSQSGSLSLTPLTLTLNSAQTIMGQASGGLAAGEAAYNYVGIFGVAERFITLLMSGIRLYEVSYF